MEIRNISVKSIEVNKGQIEGLPKNPRFIRDNRYEQLKKSIEDAPEMLSLRELIVVEHGDKYVVVGGNMRYRACVDLGYKDVPCKVLASDTPVEKLREYAIKDNVAFGKDDWDSLANEWDESELADWGVEVAFLDNMGNIDDFFNDEGQEGGKEETVEIKVQLPKELEDKKEDIKKSIELTLSEYEGVKVK